MRKRANGEGSIFYNEPRKRWAAFLRIPDGGSTKKAWRYGSTQAEVKQKLDELKADVKNGRLAKSETLKVSEFLAWWLDNVSQPNYRYATTRFYRGLATHHVNPHIGGMKLKNLDATKLTEMLAALQSDGRSPRLCQQVYDFLKKALKTAVSRPKLGLYGNVCEQVDRPKVPKSEMAVLSPTQAAVLKQAVVGDRFHAMIVLVLNTGLRWGELAGLRWKDIDLDKHRLSVKRAVITDKQPGQHERPRLAEPKSKRGRNVLLPLEAVTALRDHYEMMKAEGHIEYVFCDTKGGLLRPSNFLRRTFQPLLMKTNKELEAGSKIPKRFRFHDQRHTHATDLLFDGVHPKIVSERLGHASTAITEDIYQHALPTLQEHVISLIDKRYLKTQRVAKRVA
jgi:integrase